VDIGTRQVLPDRLSKPFCSGFAHESTTCREYSQLGDGVVAHAIFRELAVGNQPVGEGLHRALVYLAPVGSHGNLVVGFIGLRVV
jgi:hypothetical protein